MRILIAAVTLAAATAAAPAQMPGMFPWWESPVAKDLGLTEEQKNKIQATVSDWRTRLSLLSENVEAAERELRFEMDASPVILIRAEAAIEKVVTARSELTRGISLMSLQLRLILTDAQWQELQKRQLRHPGGPGMRGLGMGRRPPPGIRPPGPE